MWSVVSLYDYAFLKMKYSPLLLILLFTFGWQHNAYGNGGYILVQNYKNPFLNEINDAYHFIVSRSIGYNFFKRSPQNYHPVSPLHPLQKNISVHSGLFLD